MEYNVPAWLANSEKENERALPATVRQLGYCGLAIPREGAPEWPEGHFPEMKDFWDNKAAGCKWVVLLAAWYCIPGGQAMYTGIRGFFAVDEMGSIKQALYDASGAPELGQDVMALFDVPLLSLSFLNCKNVSRTDATTTEGPPAKWIRRQKAPEIKYYTLDIEPMRRILDTEGNAQQTGLKRALHICRGHFARYTEDGPGLFGRGQYGQFWIPSHVKGNAKHGTVVKDYRVKT